jgi:hypothetical protein
MPSIYGCGSNLYGQLRPQEHDALSFETPIELLPHDPDEKPPAQLVAVSEAQVLVRASQRQRDIMLQWADDNQARMINSA